MKVGNIARVLVICFITCLAVIAGLMYYRLGLYKDATVHGMEKASFKFIYAEHQGPYNEVVPLLQKVEVFAKDNQLSCKQTFGEYLDSPDLVDPDRLRSHVGCVLQSHEKIDPALLKQNDYFLKTVAEKEYLKLTFEGSPAVGPLKVYPEAHKWAKTNKVEIVGSTLEIYNIFDSGRKILTEFYFTTE